ncbi:MAG: hypothetical protein ACOX3T_06000 [Bdellovibrionota bacterium]
MNKIKYILFFICAFFFVSCAQLKPVPKERYINKNSNYNKHYNRQYSDNSNKQLNTTSNTTNTLVSSTLVGNNQARYSGGYKVGSEADTQSESAKDVGESTNSTLDHLKEVARENKKEFFSENNDYAVSPSVPKGIFTVRNTNFITVGEKGDVWLWSANLKNRSHVENLGTCVDRVDLDHNTLALFWSCGAKLYTKELLNDKSVISLDRIKTRASAFTVFNNATQFLVGGADGKLYRWESPLKINITDFNNFERYTAHSTVVSAVAFHPEGRVFFSGDWQGKFKAWISYKEDEFSGKYDENLFGGRFFEEGSMVKDSGRVGGSIEKIVVSPNGDYVLLGLQNSIIEIWKLRSFKKVLDFSASDLRLLDAKFVSNNQFITLARDNKIKLWQFDEIKDDLGDSDFKEMLIGEKELEEPVLLYVAKTSEILFADEKGDLKNVDSVIAVD